MDGGGKWSVLLGIHKGTQGFLSELIPLFSLCIFATSVAVPLFVTHHRVWRSFLGGTAPLTPLDTLERGDFLNLDFVIHDNRNYGVERDAINVIVDRSLCVVGKDYTIPGKVGVAARDGAVVLRGWVGDNERAESVASCAETLWYGDEAGCCVIDALHADKSVARKGFGFYL